MSRSTNSSSNFNNCVYHLPAMGTGRVGFNVPYCRPIKKANKGQRREVEFTIQPTS
jgi:hypothetical protein